MHRCLELSIIFLLMLSPVAAWGKTVTATSCTAANVQTAITSASNGDTVAVPSGNCIWASSVVIDKGITLQGAGIDQTNILISGSGVIFQPTSSTSGAGILLKEGVNNTRITGFTFDGDAAHYNDFMAIRISRALQKLGCHDFRIDNNKFRDFRRPGVFGNGMYVIRSYGFNYGVIDNNTFQDCRGEVIYLSGDGSDAFARVPELGGYTNGTIFVEDNKFLLTGVESLDGANPLDMAEGARVVFRYNRVEGTSTSKWQQPIELHGFCVDDGLGSPVNDVRGTLSFEFYNNVICQRECSSNSGSGDRVYRIRGGKGVIFGNESHGNYYAVIYLVNERSYNYGCQTATKATPAYENQCHVDTSSTLINEGLVSGNLIFANCRDQPLGVYFWNNTHNGVAVTTSDVDVPSVGYVRSDIVLGREYFFLAKPGYVPFAYPHPLRGGTLTLAAPQNLRVVP